MKNIFNFKSFIIFFLFCFSCKNRHITDVSEAAILFKDSNSLGLLIKGRKEGVWRFSRKDTFEFKCYTNGLPDSVALYFILKNNKLSPLGVKINNFKQGIWFDYNKSNDFIEVFNQNIKLMPHNLQQKTLISGKKAIVGWANNINKKSGLHLTYSDTTLLFSNTFINGIMTGVFIVNPSENDSTYSCSCAKDGYLNGYSFKYYLDDKIANIIEYNNGKASNIETFFNRNGEVFRKVAHNGRGSKVIYGIDSGTLLPPPPPPPNQ